MQHCVFVDGLIGRESEFAAIGSALRRADLTGVVLIGDAGVGKSHLLGATLRHADLMGFSSSAITGTRALADIPLAAFASMLPSRLAGDASDLVQIRKALQHRAGGRPILLGIDDAHLLDDASATLAHQMAGDLTAFVVATIRSGEIPPEAVTSLLKDGLAVRIQIDAFNRVDLTSFAESTLGCSISAEIEQDLWDRTLGNPLFIRELLLQARATGALALRHDRYELVQPFASPDTLVDLIDSRLAGLSVAHHRAAALVAVGGPLEIDLLEQLVDPDALVQLEDARVLAADEVDETLMVRFVHPVYADATRRRLGRLAARQLLRELATTLAASPKRRPEDILRIATWRLDAGVEAEPALLMQAARLATGRNDHALAERLAGLAFDTEPSLRAATMIANSLVEQGRHGEAHTLLRDERINHGDASDGDRFRWAMIEASVSFWGLGSATDALRVIDDFQSEFPAATNHTVAFRGSIAAACGQPHQALAQVPVGSAAATTPLGLFTVITSLTSLGRPVLALQTVGTLPDNDRAAAGAITQVCYAFTMIDAGRVDEALALGVEGWERAVRIGDVHGRVAWSIAIGWAELNFGRRAAASRWFSDAAELARHSAASNHGVRWALGGGLLASILAGDLDAARRLRDQLDELPAHDAVMYAHMEWRGRAWLQAADEGLEFAVASLLVRIAETKARGDLAPWLFLILDVARLGRPELAVELLGDGEFDVDGALLPTIVRLLHATARRDAEDTAAASDELQLAGFRVLAAEGAAWAWAMSRENGDDARVVTMYSRRAQDMRDQIESYATPAFTGGPPEVSLSRREREIAMLVAHGHSSREVADELIIGVRTVESHLARVYAKLGVRSRVELAEVFGLAGATS